MDRPTVEDVLASLQRLMDEAGAQLRAEHEGTLVHRYWQGRAAGLYHAEQLVRELRMDV